MTATIFFVRYCRTETMWNYLKKTNKPIVLYGMGNGADKVLNVCQQHGISVAGVFASDEFVRHNTFHGYTVTSYREAKETFGDMVVLVCFGTARPEVLARVKAISQEQELYIPDLPVYGDGVFTYEYYKEHLAEFQEICNALADEQSKTAWEQLLNYRLTGKLDFLLAAQTEPEEAWRQILQPTNHEHYLDLGAYCGDTVQDFVRHVSNYAAITAVEPDPKTFLKLQKNTDGLHNCRTVHAACGSIDGTCLFSPKSGRGSSISGKGIEIPAIRVDSLSPTVPFTLINMDVEGAEFQTLAGMEQTIRTCRPKLQIAAYHRVEDYFTLAKKVLELESTYRLYLRHFPGIPAWDTNLFFI